MIEESMLCVREFMEEFGQKSSATLYYKLVQEELEEMVHSDDRMNLYKEAADLQYVVDGLKLSYGIDPLDFANMFRKVHEANMSKRSDTYEEVEAWITENQLNATVATTKSGKYIAVDKTTKKILKGPNYVVAKLTYDPY